ncbi:hypothetical protein LY76DRAFT_591265 [Colletotrichum caudatum]|nr:hypothetical protein LY76DRAFT_591265 [Colletotrichum caudatum]
MFRRFFFRQRPSHSHARKEPPILAPALPACSELDQSQWRDRANNSIPPLSLYGRGWPACRAKLRSKGGVRATVGLELWERQDGRVSGTPLFLLLCLRPPSSVHRLTRVISSIPALSAARLTRSDER